MVSMMTRRDICGGRTASAGGTVSENDAVHCRTSLGMALGPPASANVLSIRDHFTVTATMRTMAVG